MKTTIQFLAVLLLSLIVAQGATLKNFPAHWGKPPEIQTHDYVELPGGYGSGSSTLAKWIAKQMEKDKDAAQPVTLTVHPPLYENNFENAEAGQLPDDFMALEGDFTVKQDGTNKFLELPGAPLDSFAVLFGPATNANVSVSARICGTPKGRLNPVFGVGLCGVVGYRLQISPGKRALEIYKDTELKATVPHEWKPGGWTRVRLRVVSIKDGEWQLQGKVWADGDKEPAGWQVEFTTNEKPTTGRASVTGSPYSGKPIWYDDLLVESAGSDDPQSKSEQLMK